MHLPGKKDCCWAETAVATSYATLTRSEKTDVAVVGAGIVGLTAAYSLIRAGLSVTVLVLLHHKILCRECLAICAEQQGHRGRVLTKAAIRRRRMVAIEWGM
jgi:glycine/D-amino acid oxidase-like deaminating enzyme